MSPRAAKRATNGGGKHVIEIKGSAKQEDVILSGEVGKPRSANEIDRRLGQKLRFRRNEVGMSQGELADKLGVSFQQVQKYEKGVNRVHSIRLHEIARILETDMDYFLGDIGKKLKRADSAFGDFMMTREGPMIMEAMIAIENPELRRAVITLARNLAGLDL